MARPKVDFYSQAKQSYHNMKTKSFSSNKLLSFIETGNVELRKSENVTSNGWSHDLPDGEGGYITD